MNTWNSRVTIVEELCVLFIKFFIFYCGQSDCCFSSPLAFCIGLVRTFIRRGKSENNCILFNIFSISCLSIVFTILFVIFRIPVKNKIYCTLKKMYLWNFRKLIFTDIISTYILWLNVHTTPTIGNVFMEKTSNCLFYLYCICVFRYLCKLKLDK